MQQRSGYSDSSPVWLQLQKAFISHHATMACFCEHTLPACLPAWNPPPQTLCCTFMVSRSPEVIFSDSKLLSSHRRRRAAVFTGWAERFTFTCKISGVSLHECLMQKWSGEMLLWFLMTLNTTRKKCSVHLWGSMMEFKAPGRKILPLPENSFLRQPRPLTGSCLQSFK